MSAKRKAKSKSPKRARARQLLVRLSDEERAAVDAAAERAGQPVAWWVRRALMAAAGRPS